MRLTCVIHSLDGGGAERVMARLASLLAARGHNVTLITLDNGCSDRHAVTGDVQRVFLNVAGNSRHKLAAVLATGRRLRRLRQAIHLSRPDAVLSFCDATNCLTLLATRAMRAPLVVSERSDPSSQRLPFPWQSLRPWLYRRAAAVVSLTPSAAASLTGWNRRLRVIASAVELPRSAHPEPLPAGGRRTIVAVGRLEREKGFDLLIDAFARLADRFPEVDLAIYGEGTQRAALQSQCDAHGLRNRVSMPGWVSPIWPRLKAGKVFVLSSRYEGFPSALLEAMAAGMACVASDCPSGPAAIVRHEIDGLLVPTESPADLAAGIERLLQSPELATRLGQAATDVAQRFSWDTMVDAYEAVLKEAAVGM